MMQRPLCILFGLISLLGIYSCVQSDYDSGSADKREPGTLLVGITTNAPPLAFREGGGITGLEAEFAQDLAAFAGKKARFVDLKWEDQIPALLAGKTDIIMSGMSITDARSYQVKFCQPYMISGQVSLVRLAEAGRFSNGFTDLLNPTLAIGTVSGTTGDFFIEKNVARGKKVRFAAPEQGVQALLANRVDAFVYDLPMNFYFGARNEINGLTPVTIPMTRERIAWAVRKDDPELLQTADRYLATIKENGRLKEMLVRWIPYFANVFNR